MFSWQTSAGDLFYVFFTYFMSSFMYIKGETCDVEDCDQFNKAID